VLYGYFWSSDRRRHVQSESTCTHQTNHFEVGIAKNQPMLQASFVTAKRASYNSEDLQRIRRANLFILFVAGFQSRLQFARIQEKKSNGAEAASQVPSYWLRIKTNQAVFLLRRFLRFLDRCGVRNCFRSEIHLQNNILTSPESPSRRRLGLVSDSLLQQSRLASYWSETSPQPRPTFLTGFQSHPQSCGRTMIFGRQSRRFTSTELSFFL
jgi:hypothetical protein